MTSQLMSFIFNKTLFILYFYLFSVQITHVFFHKTYRSFATTVSQLKIRDFSREASKGFEVL
jgi:hypothetical protein